MVKSFFFCSGTRATGDLHTKLKIWGHVLSGDKSVSQFLVKLSCFLLRACPISSEKVLERRF